MRRHSSIASRPWSMASTCPGSVSSRPLADVEQVEVLRGLRGTLYGANALAGLTNVVTHAPTAEPEGRLGNP